MLIRWMLASKTPLLSDTQRYHLKADKRLSARRPRNSGPKPVSQSRADGAHG
jgi:hypothetical protein